jgi:8-amino-7-oxononanoate synthase
MASWGVQHAAAQGAAVHVFAARHVAALERLMAATACGRRRLFVVCDGLRPGQDRQSPLAAFATLVARHGGCLVLDDTQALGVVGAGGGGSLRRHGLIGAPVLVGASLAKGFGAPLAVLAGPRRALQRFEAASRTRVHTSPPSAANIESARHALAVNRCCGDRLRARLLQRVRQFRSHLSALRLRCSGGDFPVQQLLPLPGIDMAALHAALLARRVRTVLHANGASGSARLSFIFTAALSAACVDRAVLALAQAILSLRQTVRPQLVEAS